jgi:hypothetical protein
VDGEGGPGGGRIDATMMMSGIKKVNTLIADDINV